MSESEMVERGARAVHRAQNFPNGAEPAWIEHAWNASAADRELSRMIARAVIEAMEELVPVVRDHEGLPAHQLVGAPADIWRAFIRAALERPERDVSELNEDTRDRTADYNMLETQAGADTVGG